MNRTPVAVITGASSGIGAATAEKLAEAGFELVMGARRLDKLEEVAARAGGRAVALDVTDAGSVEGFVSQIDRIDLLVNNAGLASGLEPVESLSEERVRVMWETNFLGVLRMTQGLLPRLLENEGGHIINLGSIASFETYPMGAGYTASKHALRALTRTLRLELLGKPIRVTEISPGLVETEFSIVRFDGDETRAKDPYRGITPLTSDDIADCIVWAATRPPHVNIDEIIVRPIAQASATLIARAEE